MSSVATAQTTRAAPSPAFARAVDSGVLWFANHWALCCSFLIFPIIALPLVAPLLEAAGYQLPASIIYFAYSLTCHQLPERSFHLYGRQLAYCERDTAIFTTVFVGLVIAGIIPRVRVSTACSLRVAVLLSAPLIVDGVTQLIGLRESTWELRVLTGAIFAAGWCAFGIPRLNAGFQTVATVVAQRRSLGSQA